MQASATPMTSSAPGTGICTSCGRQNNPGVNFCAGCGHPISASTATPQTNYGQSGPYPQQPQYPQAQYQQYPQNPQQYPQYAQQPQYGQQYPAQYGQPGYQQDPMLGQQPMVLRCPTCMAMSQLGTTNCPSCHASLAGIVPTPANVPMQGQQGGLGGFMQGNGGKYAMGALGGAAAVLGGEMLLHGIEGERGYERRREGDGLLGGLGDIANDVGLF